MNPAVISATRTASSPAASEPEPELRERRLDGGGREHEVAGPAPPPCRPPTTSDRLAAAASARRSRAGPRRRSPEVRRELVERAEQARGRVRVAVAEVRDRVDVAAEPERLRQAAGREGRGVGGRRAPRPGSRTERLKSACWRASASSRSRSEASTNAYTPMPIAATVSATSTTSVIASRVRMPRIVRPVASGGPGARGLVAGAADGQDQRRRRRGRPRPSTAAARSATSTRRESPR